jgi:acyl-CoA ligase (AMP-forming) (exosortase A-associated)
MATQDPSFRPPAGVTADTSTRIDSLLFGSAAKCPTNTAIVDGKATLDYQTLAGYAAGFAADLTKSGVCRGETVAIFLDKTPEAVVALFGTWAAGAVVVPVNESLRSRQVAHILNHSGSRFLVSTVRRLSRLEPDSYKHLAIIEPTLRTGEWPIRAQSVDSAMCNEMQPATILYTSGSTGRPKGILISHANLLAGTGIVSRYLELRRDDRILSILPFSFGYGLNQLLTAVNVGATLVLIRSHMPAEICRAMGDNEITGCAAVPPLWIQLMSDVSPFRTMTFPKLRYITNSGGVFPVHLVRQYRKHLPQTRIYLMYGLSEAFRSTYLSPELVDERPDSIGKAIPETEILVVNENGDECAAGEVGELVHRGPTVAMGYWNDPDATARVFRPDTLPGGDPNQKVVFSGDLVKKDGDESLLYFVGRRDTMIKSQGYRISPEEIEEIILSSQLVTEVGVCGRPDPQSGAVVVAHVVPRDVQHFDTEAFMSYCQTEMPSYMQPRQVIVHDALPRTASGKIDRQGLKGLEW